MIVQKIINIAVKISKKKNNTNRINTKILKLCLKDIGNKFHLLINISMQKGVFPIWIGTSTIIPIKKNINIDRCDQFRPINENFLTILGCFSLKKFI